MSLRQIKLNFSLGKPIGKYAEKLMMFDEYFEMDDPSDPEEYLNRIKDEKGLCYALSTWAFDNGFDVDEDSWNMLKRIAKNFGEDISSQVLYNMFHRRHDT